MNASGLINRKKNNELLFNYGMKLAYVLRRNIQMFNLPITEISIEKNQSYILLLKGFQLDCYAIQ